MKNSIRKTRSDKFPLTLHPSGQYCKKIKGHIYYFGSDRKASISRELTKIHEENIRGNLSDLVEHFREKSVKGEIVIILGPKL